MANLQTFTRGICPKASREEANSFLWCCSPFPFIRDVRKVRRALRKCLRDGGGTIHGAIDHAHEELDRAMAQFKSKQGKDYKERAQ